MTSAVVDASAFLMIVKSEPGWERAADVVENGAISAVNMAEIVSKMYDLGYQPSAIEPIASRLNTYDFTQDLARRAGYLRGPTRAAGLSLGDRACLALAMSLGLPAITADRAWLDIADTIGVEIVLARPEP
ncbi:MAG: type II toxin-antitoxin system VapC family toxin [Pseudomonadota bacterium]